MIVRLKERQPMFIDKLGNNEVIWFESGEIFEVVEIKRMKHDNREWFKVKSKWFTNSMAGFHSPDSFDVVKSKELKK